MAIIALYSTVVNFHLLLSIYWGKNMTFDMNVVVLFFILLSPISKYFAKKYITQLYKAYCARLLRNSCAMKEVLFRGSHDCVSTFKATNMCSIPI